MTNLFDDLEVGSVLAVPVIFSKTKAIFYREITVERMTATQAICNSGERIRLADGYIIGSSPRNKYVYRASDKTRAINSEYEAQQKARLEANKLSPEEERRLDLINSLVNRIEFGNYSIHLLTAIDNILDGYDDETKKLTEE